MSEAHTSSIVIAGAIAFDQIARSATSLSERPIAQLNVKLTDINQTLGGCGANIAYNLAQLGCPHRLISYCGHDDSEMLFTHCARQGIATNGILAMTNGATPRALIITDTQGRQFTGFFPGGQPDLASWQQHLNLHLDTVSQTAMFIQAPLPGDIMIAGLEAAQMLVPEAVRIWVPGQYAEIVSAEESRRLNALAHIIIGNVHEIDQLNRAPSNDTNTTLVTTNGANEIKVRFAGGELATYPVQPVAHQADPTGCGDTFVAALASRLGADSWASRSKLFDAAIAFAASAAAQCLQHTGAQAHNLQQATVD